MNLLEYLISLVAPHSCLVCRANGRLLCKSCSLTSLSPMPSKCYKCKKASMQNRTCRSCKKKTPVSRVWAAVWYESTAKDLIYKLKFDRAKSAAGDIARVIGEDLPILPDNTVVTHLPTAGSRARMRGYDQAQLIAKNLAKNKGLRYKNLLNRKGKLRQVGSARKDRFNQLRDAFFVNDARKVRGKQVLLVDDVLTTGASVESAAKELNKAGARKIEVAVFAQS